MITNVYLAPDIRTAEAAKVIENIQRDLNIALFNELSLICQKNASHFLQIMPKHSFQACF